MTTDKAGARGRHRGESHDPVGVVLTGVWALGHVVTVFLLGTTVVNQLDADHHGLAHTSLAAPDHEPLA
ncbi:hypothetical protein ABZW10_00570 [Kitasatospora sp. NPDC004723]|uniref:hypothetical protein n=1 Tax=Kitasatospora sp. NPDC004723 TaxID=3154288 RepID=UPI0033A1267C